MGNVSVTVVPWCRTLSRRISPLWLRTYAWLMLSPSPVPRPRLVVKKGSKNMRQNIRRDAASGVTDPNFNHVDKGQLAGRNGNAPALGRSLGCIQQKIHQHLRQLVRVRANMRQIPWDSVLELLPPQHRLMLEERQRVFNQTMQADLAENERAWPRVIHQSVQGR